ncbi:hypothetical protein POVCU2_0024780 [Plasmodium ovale curtisi]|uniref:Uncharacterized protein n=1 Tax=Plasmodium ovale curtisi TaxID=864141 RepID=A0A1A8VWU2_PLAOA|nr:hypothetical protein POVCU2_0024780 [Plasmodium ovale curtisi]SBS92320.1 hypothetical protein POVCU1_022520 [Plasmodium ovale curtisi]
MDKASVFGTEDCGFESLIGTRSSLYELFTEIKKFNVKIVLRSSFYLSRVCCRIMLIEYVIVRFVNKDVRKGTNLLFCNILRGYKYDHVWVSKSFPEEGKVGSTNWGKNPSPSPLSSYHVFVVNVHLYESIRLKKEEKMQRGNIFTRKLVMRGVVALNEYAK